MTNLQSSRWRLTRLLAGCPHSLILESNPRDCPLHEIRAKPLEDRLEWARNRDPAVVERILEYHGWCLARKTVEDLTARRWPEGGDPERDASPDDMANERT